MKSISSILWFAVVLLVAIPMAAWSQDEPVREEIPSPPDSLPRLYLSWNTPWGQPGSASAKKVACGDTMQIDTLYLSFDVPKPTPYVLGMSGMIYFHPQKGDSLGPFWHFKRGWENEMNLRIDFDTFTGFPCEMPWRRVGQGTVNYDHRSGRGRLDLDFQNTVDFDLAQAIPGTRYCFARVMIRHRRCDLSGFKQPVGIEFARAEIRLSTRRVMTIERGDHRFVTWNAPPGKVQWEMPASTGTKVKPWSPGTVRNSSTGN